MPPQTDTANVTPDYTSIRVTDDLADELHARKDRGDSYEDVIREALEKADAYDDEQADTDAGGGDPAVDHEGDGPTAAPHASASASADADTDREAANTRRSAPGETGERSDVRETIRESAADAFPGHKDTVDCLGAVMAARAYLRDDGPASMREIVAAVMPDHPLGYDVDSALTKIESGNHYRGAWWHKIVKPGLKAAPDVGYDDGDKVWYYAGDTEGER